MRQTGCGGGPAQKASENQPHRSLPEAFGHKALRRWGSALTSLLFAAVTVAYLLEGASIGAVMFAATLAVWFGVFAWREWRRISPSGPTPAPLASPLCDGYASDTSSRELRWPSSQIPARAVPVVAKPAPAAVGAARNSRDSGGRVGEGPRRDYVVAPRSFKATSATPLCSDEAC